MQNRFDDNRMKLISIKSAQRAPSERLNSHNARWQMELMQSRLTSSPMIASSLILERLTPKHTLRCNRFVTFLYNIRSKIKWTLTNTSFRKINNSESNKIHPRIHPLEKLNERHTANQERYESSVISFQE